MMKENGQSSSSSSASMITTPSSAANSSTTNSSEKRSFSEDEKHLFSKLKTNSLLSRFSFASPAIFASESKLPLEDNFNIFWSFVFSSEFYQKENSQRDDLLFFVTNDMSKIHKRGGEKKEKKERIMDKDLVVKKEKFIVLRANSPKLPPVSDLTVNWEQTVYLNSIVNHFQYTLTVIKAEKKTQ
eukprot:TRINITY_DN2794_c0_g1_i2.p1 TRINITY_DN2794_c0_g1~~TRINITY_DN2794_c0_g1_i2.p1  ORF type:complete len:185 (+),score=70.61 TRINITY_DN2794_c0_g1_i2:1405-1959(+)